MFENKFRAPTLHTAGVGSVVRESSMARLLLGFPRALSFEVSFICYGPDDAMLVPTLVHSKLDSSALPDVELVLATIEHFLSVPCAPAVSKQRTPRPAPLPTVARLRLSPRLAPAARQEAGHVLAHLSLIHI